MLGDDLLTLWAPAASREVNEAISTSEPRAQHRRDINRHSQEDHHWPDRERERERVTSPQPRIRLSHAVFERDGWATRRSVSLTGSKLPQFSKGATPV